MGLRTVRKGETFRVKVGKRAGQEGPVKDVGTEFAIVEFADGTDMVALDHGVRIVTSQIDKDIDSPLAEKMYEDVDDLVAKFHERYAEVEQEEVERVASKLGLPAELLQAIGLLPTVKRLIPELPEDAGDVVSKIVKGLATAAMLIGAAKPVYDRVKALGE
jgi:hypothetical protein